MRSLAAALLSIFLPAHGKRRAEPEPAPAAHPAPPPTSGAARTVMVVDAETLPLVPRYLEAFEQERERQAQRARRRSLALAAIGQDYVPERAA